MPRAKEATTDRIGYSSIIEAARASFDNDERTELFHRFHAIVHDEQPYTFWFQIREVGAWRAGIQNVTFSALRPFDYAAYWFMD